MLFDNATTPSTLTVKFVVTNHGIVEIGYPLYTLYSCQPTYFCSLKSKLLSKQEGSQM
jgi:hypothetical protein